MRGWTNAVPYQPELEPDFVGQLPEPTEPIRPSHLFGRTTLWLEQARSRDQDDCAARATRRNVQSVRVVEKREPPWRILGEDDVIE